jgi:hypothetical protein
MKLASDMRIPVLFGDVQAEKDDVYLTEGGAEPVRSGYAEQFTLPEAKFGHVVGCTCCTPRSPAADALARLFRARATGSAPFFKRVIVRASPAGEAAIGAAIARDMLTAARYRLPD